METNWKLIKRYRNYLELWQTPTCFLVCCKHIGLFKFFKDPSDALNFIESELNKD